tara:strand:+ start:1031 stop:1198 length:168 start_codon:yes stop_codon:yes gene_type:complete
LIEELKQKMQINQIIQKKKLNSPKNTTSELIKLNKLYEVGTIDKKEFNTAKKLLS